MKIRLSEELIKSIGVKALAPYGIEQSRVQWSSGREVDLAAFSRAKVLDFRNLIEPKAKSVKGLPQTVRDVTLWLAALKDVAGVKPRTVEQFTTLCTRYLLAVPGHRVYRLDAATGCWLAYYVGSVEYSPRREDRGHIYPAKCVLTLFYFVFGTKKSESLRYFEQQVRGVSIEQGLAAHGLMIETPELRADYLAVQARYEANVMCVGQQMLARGTGTNDLDGNKKESESWYYRRTQTLTFDKHGEPSPVVIDVFRESDTTDEEETDEEYDVRYWVYATQRADDEDDETDEAFTPPEVPTHPIVAVFDLRRHMRCRVHIGQLELYVYDTALGAKLVLPDDDRALIEVLLTGSSPFVDIIAGKGGGAVVLCTGRPGLGKTLTAEVYAEVIQRPLFSVQCSQLGTTPDALEDELLKNFARAERWGAILLLDEADVYVSARGSDLFQNAIVGVFLRVLEYYKGVLFMTTNRADLVDDAIASRCIARLEYTVPNAGQQAKIWRILADTAGLTLTDVEIRSIVKQFPSLSGRDIKNLLKLASFVQSGRAISSASIAFVKRFKPTTDLV